MRGPLCCLVTAWALASASSRRARRAMDAPLDEIDIHAEPSSEVLCLPGPKWAFNWPGGGFVVNETALYIGVVANSGLGTGLTVWDGAVVLSKLLEAETAAARARGEPGPVAGRTVLELGAGTGVVGLAAAALGARRTVLTDQEYTLANLRATAARNVELAGRVDVLELDWDRPAPGLAALAGAGVSLIVAADVVWVPELVQPLVRTLSGAFAAFRGSGVRALLAHQTRARATDALLWALLAEEGISAAPVPPERYDAVYQHPDIQVFELWRPADAGDEEGGGGRSLFAAPVR